MSEAMTKSVRVGITRSKRCFWQDMSDLMV